MFDENYQSGVGEILTNVLKCDFWDVDDMANKIVAVLRHPPLQRTLRDSGFFEVTVACRERTEVRVAAEDRRGRTATAELVLEPGGAENPMEMYVRFRGSEPSVEPLIERRGLGGAE